MENTILENKMFKAQAQLIHRASILMLAGYGGRVTASCHPSIDLFHFAYGDVQVYFDDEHAFNDDEINAAIAQLDAKIEQHYKAGALAVSVIKAWRGE